MVGRTTTMTDHCFPCLQHSLGNGLLLQLPLPPMSVLVSVLVLGRIV
jgi:hypothetical protein